MKSSDIIIMTLAFIAAFASLLVVLHVLLPVEEEEKKHQSKPPHPTHLNRSSNMR